MALVLQGGLWWGYIVTFLERRLLLEDKGEIEKVRRNAPRYWLSEE